MSKPKSTKDIRIRAQDAAKLAGRIAANATAQEVDLNAWIFQHLDVPAGARVLELCAGTGAQSVNFLSRLTAGRLVATDRSAEALDALMAKVGEDARSRLTTFPCDMDQVAEALRSRTLFPPAFDLVFSAYGLYYSKDAGQLLNTLKSLLLPDGRIAIVGPHGDNNVALFTLLREAGVTLPQYITWTSGAFMPELVLPWAEKNFQECRVSTLVNPVIWKDPEALLTYWRNSTFFDAQRESQVRDLLLRHFAREGEFKDAKHVMLAEMRKMR